MPPPYAPASCCPAAGPAPTPATSSTSASPVARGKLIIVADVAYFEETAPDGIVAAILRDATREGVRIPLERAASA